MFYEWLGWLFKLTIEIDGSLNLLSSESIKMHTDIYYHKITKPKIPPVKTNEPLVEYLGTCDGLEPGWYFIDETEDPVGPYKTKWDTELVLTAYIINYTEGQEFLYLDLKKFLQQRKKF